MEKLNIVKVAENATTRRPVKVRNFLEFSKEEVGVAMYSIVCSEKKYVENMGEALLKAYSKASSEEELRAMDMILEAFTGEDLKGFTKILKKRTYQKF